MINHSTYQSDIIMNNHMVNDNVKISIYIFYLDTKHINYTEQVIGTLQFQWMYTDLIYEWY